MNKKLLFILLLFAGMANAQIVTIPDPAFKAKLVASNAVDAPNKIAQNFSDEWIAIDANGDGEIQLSEAQAIKLLTLFDPGITNLTGLTSFSNLQKLSISNNQLTSLDLNVLTDLRTFASYNMPALTSVNINNLTNLTSVIFFGLPQLSNLNISNLTNLESLGVMYCALTTLNVNGLSNLTTLRCPGNLLTNLNGLSPNLTILDCSSNLLTGLNLTTLTNLTELECSSNRLTSLTGLSNLVKLGCENNKLTALNLNGLTNLSELRCGGNELTSLNVNALSNLIKLSCSYNKIATLSISGLANLVSLDCGNNFELASVTLANLPALQEFSVIGGIASNSQSLSSLTTLNLSGLPNLQKLNCSNGKLATLNLTGLSNLTDLDCSGNLITSLTLTNLPNLKNLSCTRNPLASLNASNLPSLEQLYCASGYIVDGQLIPSLTNLNVTGLSNLKRLDCSLNLLTALDLTGLNSLEELYCYGMPSVQGHITSLNVNALSNLKNLNCSYQALNSLNVSNLTNLKSLSCSNNNISSLDLTGLVNLEVLDYNYNQLASLNLVNLPMLTDLNCSHNQLETLNVLNLTNLKNLSCTANSLTTLNLSGLSNLTYLDFSYNQLTLSDVSGLSTNLKTLVCASNNLTSLDVSGLTSLETLNCNTNLLTGLNLSSLVNLKNLECSWNQISTLDVSALHNLESLVCNQNQLSEINITGLNNLVSLHCANNHITGLDLSNHLNMKHLDYSYNNIPNLDVNFLTNLTYLSCGGTNSTVLDVSNLTQLQNLLCETNQLTTINVNNSPYLNELRCYDNQLATLFIKNGINESLNFSTNPGLQFICADDSQIESIQTTLNGLNMNATVCNAYCSFTPGGNHNTVTGIAIFDADNNGCDVTDEVNPFVRLNINDGTLDGATVTNINGTYNFYTNAGNYVIAPNTENPDWFSFSPNSANFVFFDNNNNISIQNFCIAAIGLHKDIEVVFSQIESARPGFDAYYKIVFKNKGNQMQSGTVSLAFDDRRTDLVSATPAVDAVTPNLLSWNFTNLMPFENRSIALTLNINSPTEIPNEVNNGDFLDFTASINPIAGDEFPSDNQFNYHQLVVGSFDPNDISCLEGDAVSPDQIGNYLHYMVNFENTGTAAAENIVVKLEINPNEFDINSLQVMNASHPASVEVRGNIAEFKFANINLLPTAGDPPVNGHGNILFKMKSKSTLNVGDLVKNRANIYFDYNFPIETNDAETVFEVLSTDAFANDASVVVFPNPAQDKININCNNSIKSVELYDIQGRVLEVMTANKISAQLDISGKSKGVYFVKIITEKGKKVEKIIKE